MIVVIAILAAISIVAYTGIQQQAARSAHLQNIAQVERQILAHAALNGVDVASVSGSVVGYIEGVNENTLVRPLTGAPDLTLYNVCNGTGVSDSWAVVAGLASPESGFKVRLQGGPAGNASMGYRIDTSVQSNLSRRTNDVINLGANAIGWMSVSSAATQALFGYNQSAPAAPADMVEPGSEWNLTRIKSMTNGDCVALATLVFDASHDESTRSQVISWLAGKYAQ